MDPQLVIQAVYWYAGFLISVTLHEASHAFFALKFGDPTAYRGGQVTLNPIPHMRREPIGMLAAPLLSFFWNGWMIGWGSAPYDPNWALDNPRKSALMALAGPGANLLLLIGAGVLIRIGLAAGFFAAPESLEFAKVIIAPDNKTLAGLATFVSIMFSLNLILFCLNLLPLPPLDGTALPLLFLERSDARRYMGVMCNRHFSVVGIIVAWGVFGRVFPAIHLFVLNILYLGVAEYA